MKKLLLGINVALALLLNTTNVFASMPNEAELKSLESIEKNLSNPDLYKKHKVSIYKEEPHKFLFIPYTKDILVTETELTGVNTISTYGSEITYVGAISQINDVTYLNSGVVRTGLSINIFKLEKSDTQVLTVNQRDLNSLHTLDVGDVKIQVPDTREKTSIFTIDSPSFEKKWTNIDGVTYKLKYTGSKILN